MGLLKRIREHRFELQHVIILFIILAIFQFVLSYVNKYSSSNLVSKTLQMYRKDSAERIANLSATSFELLMENSLNQHDIEYGVQEDIVQAFNIIFSQQVLQENINEICILVTNEDEIYTIDDGDELFMYFFESKVPEVNSQSHPYASENYKNIRETIRQEEKIISFFGHEKAFHVYVPFVLRGEFQGVVYLKITPDLSNITRDISSAYNEIAIVFTALIMFGLLAMFYITTFTVEERDEVREQLYKEHEEQVKMQVAHEKESLFTKRIYHAHHKAEKVMGFIKEEIRSLSHENMERFKFIVIKYSNFISRVIYDMKWYDPPIHATRNPIFQSDINEIIRFLVDNLFNRVSNSETGYKFELQLDPAIPKEPINEYVIWEIIEPLIQNAIEHNREKKLTIILKTEYDPDQKISRVSIQDDGKGIIPELLKINESGVKKIFSENASTKKNAHNAGYGCYLAFEIARRKCGWILDVENLYSGGCRFVITIPHK